MALRIASVDTLLERRSTIEMLEKCRELLASIQDEIRNTAERKGTRVVYDLPTVFDISNTQNDRAQQFIYYNIMQTLEHAGYIVKIKFEGSSIEVQKIILYITWKSAARKRDESIMDKYIKSHQV